MICRSAKCASCYNLKNIFGTIKKCFMFDRTLPGQNAAYQAKQWKGNNSRSENPSLIFHDSQLVERVDQWCSQQTTQKH